MSDAALTAVSRPRQQRPPALVIALISLSYPEEDGLLLSIALLASVIVLAVELVAVNTRTEAGRLGPAVLQQRLPEFT